MKREHSGVSDMGDVLARIDSALQRAEAASERLGRRHRGLRIAARDTLAGLDRLLQSGHRTTSGKIGGGEISRGELGGVRTDG